MAKYKVGQRVEVNIADKSYKGIAEILWIRKNDDELYYLVGIKDFNGHNGESQGKVNLAKEKGYQNHCWWIEEYEILNLIGTGSEVIDLLMKKLGVEIDEEFEIEEGHFDPYHFDKNGNLINKDGDRVCFWIAELAYGDATIKKIPKPEIKEMTVAELEEALKLPKGALRVKGDD